MNKKLVVGILVGIILVSLAAAMAVDPAKAPKRAHGDGIGLIYVEGVISGAREEAGLFNGAASGQSLMEQLKRAREDDNVKAVLIRINSPGGSSAASQEVGEEVDKLRRSGKKVVASMGDVAASGGYWIAAKCDRIVANPSSMTGSIGVIMDLQNLQELFDKIGVTPQTIKSGPYKDIGTMNRPLTPSERAILQAMVDDIYSQFVDVVAKGRKMERRKVLELADGRVFTGRQAKANGLVDELGNFYDAIDLTAKLAGIEGEPKVYELGPVNPFEKFLGGVSSLTGFSNYASGLQAKDIQQLIELLKGQQAGQMR